jgi:hypothetical protein
VDLNAFDTIADPNEKKNFVGNSIYTIIEEVYTPAFAGKITGMLLDESVVDFKNLLTNQMYLSQKSKEAYNLLVQNQP